MKLSTNFCVLVSFQKQYILFTTQGLKSLEGNSVFFLNRYGLHCVQLVRKWSRYGKDAIFHIFIVPQIPKNNSELKWIINHVNGSKKRWYPIEIPPLLQNERKNQFFQSAMNTLVSRVPPL